MCCCLNCAPVIYLLICQWVFQFSSPRAQHYGLTPQQLSIACSLLSQWDGETVRKVEVWEPVA